MSKDLRMYILVNNELGMSCGKMSAQVGHAVNVYQYENSDTDIFKEYMSSNIKKIILSCPRPVLEALEKEGHTSIRDAGFTEIAPNSLTCVNIGILEYGDFPEKLNFINNLPLMK